ncbi:MAG: NACHT domain-containing protein [Agriterribacter sp.]
MMLEFDTGKLISEIIAANAESLFDASKKFLTNKSNQIKARLTNTFSEYIKNIERKYSSTKTIIYRDTPQSIKNFYEPIDLYNNNINLETPVVSDLLSFHHPIIITGTGGSGKSTFLKYLLLNSLEQTKLIPIFVELRIVEQEQKKILTYISDSLQLNKVELDSEYLKQAFEHGNFLFLIDGFDELSQQYAQEISTEIDNLSQQYSKCFFILTSRPGQDFISWSNFIELKTKPLTIEKAINLINRLNFDSEIKNNFIGELKDNLYDSHRSFFENPLLLSIMLITFRDSASIPSELHNFYSLAFEALYYRHDASKSFKRPTLTNLPINKGKEIMAAFSLITYINNQTLFSSYELQNLLLTAMKLADCECEVSELAADLQRAYCMLLQDGTKYQYTHRSFQEYFAACYLISANDVNQSKLIRQFCQRADTDITLQLAYGMNPQMLEEKLIIPFLKQFRENIGLSSEVTLDIFIKFANYYFLVVTFFEKNHASLSIASIDNTSIDNEKLFNLKIIRLILKLFKIDTVLSREIPIFESEDIKFNAGKKILEFPISEGFQIPGLLDWFLKYSLEVRVINELIELEKKLMYKNKRNSELFDSLLEEKNSNTRNITEGDFLKA